MWSAPTTSAGTACELNGPRTCSRDRRHAKRTPPTSTSCHNHAMTIRLRGNIGTGVKNISTTSPAALSVTPLKIWNSVTVLA